MARSSSGSASSALTTSRKNGHTIVTDSTAPAADNHSIVEDDRISCCAKSLMAGLSSPPKAPTTGFAKKVWKNCRTMPHRSRVVAAPSKPSTAASTARHSYITVPRRAATAARSCST